jgi:hypothetical protein
MSEGALPDPIANRAWVASDTCPVCKLGTRPTIGRGAPERGANSFGSNDLHHAVETASARVQLNVWHVRNSDDGRPRRRVRPMWQAPGLKKDSTIPA